MGEGWVEVDGDGWVKDGLKWVVDGWGVGEG